MKMCLFVAGAMLPLLAVSAPQSWTIANGQISRTLTFDAERGLYTSQLSDLSTGANFILPETLIASQSSEFSFRMDGHSYQGAGTDFQLVSVREAEITRGRSLTIRLHSRRSPLAVSIVYSVYDGHPVIRKRLIIRNDSAHPVRITHLNLEAIAPSVGPENETTLKTHYGATPREIFYTGRSEDAGLLVQNGRTGIGFAILSEVPGYMKRTEISGWNAADKVPIGVLYDTDLMPFEREISSGQEFETASVSLATFHTGDGFHDPSWVLPSYTSEILMRQVNKRGAPWIYNTWEPFTRHINGDTVMQLIDAAGAMGIDIFTIDDGWQEQYGENKINLNSFPDGLQPIRRAVEAKGMRLGLWIPMAAIGTSTAEFRNHPEWAVLDGDGKPKITQTAAGPMAVMCLASPFRDSAVRRINEAIENFHLAYVKLDLTTIFNAYGEAPGCWAKGHYHSNWQQSLNLIYEGIAYVTGQIYEKHPDVLLDLTFELWGQKHVIDAGLLAAGDLDWLSNVDDNKPDSAGPLQARTLLYQRSPSMPSESMLIGNLHAEMPNIRERFATEIGSAPLLLGDLRKLSAADLGWYHEKISWFKKLRQTWPISESFFPLGSWLQPSPTAWDGFARLARTGNGVIALFRNKSNAPSAVVQLLLIPNGKYKLHSVITGKDLGSFSKADFSRGIAVPFSKSESVEVLEMSAVR